MTENCDVDQVQVLVEQDENDAVASLRLRQTYFLTTDDAAALVGPLTREAELILTPDAMLENVLRAWRSQDWEKMYLYLDDSDGTAPAYAAFAAQLSALPPVTAWQCSPASISGDGRYATFIVDMTVLEDGALRELPGRVLRLYRRGGPWHISMAQLTGWQEVQP